MFAQTIVYVVLTLMTATAAFASSMPITKTSRDQQVTDADQETVDTREQ